MMRPLEIASASTLRKAVSTVRILPRVTIVSAACWASACAAVRIASVMKPAAANVRIGGFYRVGPDATRGLPGPIGGFNRSGQDRVPNVVDCLEAAWSDTAPLESGRLRCPVKQRDLPRVGDASALVVDEAMIGRAPRRNQPPDREP